MAISNDMWFLIVHFEPLVVFALCGVNKQLHTWAKSFTKNEDMCFQWCLALAKYDPSTLTTLSCTHEEFRATYRRFVSHEERLDILFATNVLLNMKRGFLNVIGFSSWSHCFVNICNTLYALKQRQLPVKRPPPPTPKSSTYSFPLLSANRWFARAKSPCFLLCGPDGAGKTTMMFTLGNAAFSVPSLGWGVETYSGKGWKVSSWDYGGWSPQPPIFPLWRHYFADFDGLMWMVDSAEINTCRTPYGYEDYWANNRHRMREILLDRSFSSNVLLVIAGKCEAPNARSVDQIRDLLGLCALPDCIRWHVIPVSNKHAGSHDAAIEWMYRAVLPCHEFKR